MLSFVQSWIEASNVPYLPSHIESNDYNEWFYEQPCILYCTQVTWSTIATMHAYGYYVRNIPVQAAQELLAPRVEQGPLERQAQLEAPVSAMNDQLDAISC